MKPKQKPSIFIFFGIPGSGKSYLGKKFADKFGLFFYEADDDYTGEMRKRSKISEKEKENVNREFYSLVIGKIENLLREHQKIVVASALGSNEHKHQFIERFGDKALFVLVKPDEEKHLQNIFEREWADPNRETNNLEELKGKLKRHLERKQRSFEIPDFPFLTVTNDYSNKSEELVYNNLQAYLQQLTIIRICGYLSKL